MEKTPSSILDKISNKVFVFGTLAVYALIVIILSHHHVLWRDEVQPMSAVVASSSLSDLFHKMHNYGHPQLLVTVLYLVHKVIPSYVVLKIVNVTVCVAAIYIFLAFAPFSRLQKILFILGFFPLYLYPVFNRDYSFIMLLLFAFAAVYPKRFERMVPLGIILFLLANTHAYALILTIAITGSLILEFLLSSEARSIGKARLKEVLIGLALIAGGIIFSITQIVPDQTSVYYQPHHIGIEKAVRAFIQSLIRPGEVFPTVLGISKSIFATLVIFLVYFYLLPKRYLFLFFFFAVIGFGMFYHLIFESTEIRYQGSFYLLLVTVLWLDAYTLDRPWKREKNIILILLLVLQIGMAYPALKEEIRNDYSSSKSFGKLVQNNPSFKGAIVVGEPDNNLESIPYYADNPIYLIREERFAKYRQLTTANRQELSLAELLSASRKLKDQSGKPLLIILGYKLSPEGPFTIVSSHHGKIFTYSKESLADFSAHTDLVGSFHKAVCDENYDVYLLK